jgi:hypothetical protein
MEEGQTDTDTLSVWNNGGGVLDYNVATNVDWLDVTPKSGTSSGPNVVNTHTVIIHTNGLSLGAHNGLINIDDSQIPVDVNIVNPTQNPILTLSSNQHNFLNKIEGQTDSTTFEIWNSGADTLTYTLYETRDWLEISSTGGDSTGPADKDAITVGINTTGLAVGSYSYDISIDSNGGIKTFKVILNVVEEIPVLSIMDPEPGVLYFRGQKLMDLSLFDDLSIIIGSIEISISISGLADGTLELYVDDNFEESISLQESSFELNKKLIGRKTIKVVAVNSEDVEVASDQMDAIIFNLGFFKN